MNILITGSGHPIARAIIAALSGAHTVRTIEDGATLRDPAACDDAVRGVNLVFHVAPLLAGLTATADEDPEDLDSAARGTFQLARAAQAAGVPRFIVASTLALFDAIPPEYSPSPLWRPRPQPRVADFCAYAGEVLTRERVRDGAMKAACVRFGVLSDEEIRVWARAQPDAGQPENWAVAHLGQRAPASVASYKQVPPRVPPAHPRVALIGAGGPLGATLADLMHQRATLRRADLLPLSAAQPQTPGAPLPGPLPAPHEEILLDISRPGQVMRA